MTTTWEDTDKTYYVMDVSGAYAQVIAELDADKEIKVLYTRGDGIISREEKSEAGESSYNFYLSDGHGDVRQLTGETGEVTDSYSYNSFGELKESHGETDNPYLYTGEYYDEGTGLYYLRARYMNPETGTFTSMDTYRGNTYDPASLHRYTYAQNNPQMYTDPSGHFVSTFISGVWRNKVSIAIMGAVNGVINSIVNEVFGGEDKDSTLVAFFKGFAVGAGCAAVYYGVAAIKTLSVVMQVIEVLALSQEVIECASNVVMLIVYGVTGHHTQMAIYIGFATLCLIDILVELGVPGKIKAEGPRGKATFDVDVESGKTTVTHRGTNENIAQKLQLGYLPANYPNPNNAVTRALDHSKPAVWVSEGKPNWFNRIFFGMVGKRGEASITFEIDSSLLTKPDGLIKRFFGKAQRVIEGDVPIPDDVIIKWGGGK